LPLAIKKQIYKYDNKLNTHIKRLNNSFLISSENKGIILDFINNVRDKDGRLLSTQRRIKYLNHLISIAEMHVRIHDSLRLKPKSFHD
jgi:hypothetical protein